MLERQNKSFSIVEGEQYLSDHLKKWCGGWFVRTRINPSVVRTIDIIATDEDACLRWIRTNLGQWVGFRLACVRWAEGL